MFCHAKVLNERTRNIFNQDALQATEASHSSDNQEGVFSEEEDAFLVALGEHGKGLLVIAKHGKDADIAQFTTPLPSDDMRSWITKLNWPDIRREYIGYHLFMDEFGKTELELTQKSHSAASLVAVCKRLERKKEFWMSTSDRDWMCAYQL